eukprot:TRINITY_DN5341_c0_g1_i1.p1 TRINITY_DN5341_c0_g1~~TRINITY_DN5341_c0_g1_i1.p1  ORF type:complete len:515 (+),score=72.40 TRINITY_DN5341_c0_g1_i1:126-1670(+)
MKEILTPFFAALSSLSFAQAGQILTSRTPSPPTLSIHIPLSIPKLFACLNLLCVAETSYHRRTHLSSSKSTSVAPSSTLFSSYTTLINELKQLIPSLDGKSTVVSTSLPLGRRSSMGLPHKYQASPPNTHDDDEETVYYETLVQQLILFVQLRMELLSVYHFFVLIGTPPSKISTYDKVLAALDTLAKKFIEKISHTLLQQMKVNISSEVNALHSLVSAQISISRQHFKDSVLLLFSASNTLKQWKSTHTPSQVLSPSSSQSLSNLSSGSIGLWPENGVYQFLGIFLSALIAKSALYFYYPLKERNFLSAVVSPPSTPNYSQTSSSGLLNIGGSGSDSGSFGVFHSLGRNIETDYIAAIALFVHKSGASNFSVVFECKGSPFSKLGYSCISSDPPTGINSFPAIFSFPKEPPILEHWPTLISLVMQNDEELSTQPVSECVYFYDTKLDTSYFINRSDPDVFMVAIFKEKKKSADGQIRDFMSSISRALRNVDIFSLLKNKGKKKKKKKKKSTLR